MDFQRFHPIFSYAWILWILLMRIKISELSHVVVPVIHKGKQHETDLVLSLRFQHFDVGAIDGIVFLDLIFYDEIIMLVDGLINHFRRRAFLRLTKEQETRIEKRKKDHNQQHSSSIHVLASFH